MKLDVPVGARYGRLTVIKEVEKIVYPKGGTARNFLCLCDCGTKLEVRLGQLTSGGTKSCGCWHKHRVSEMCKARKKSNKYEFKADCVIGYTRKGKSFVIDTEDYDKIKNYCWCINGQHGYIVTRDKEKVLFMHRLIMDAPKGMVVDHINHVKTDNRKNNLRVCTQHQNCMNNKRKGYRFIPELKKWLARIVVNRKTIHLGYFETEAEAMLARALAKKKYFGEFACDVTNCG